MSRLNLFLFAVIFSVASSAYSQLQFTCYPVGAEETPPNTSTGWGVGRFVLSADQDTLYYSLFWKIPHPYLSAHIHVGALGVPGGIWVNLANANASGAHGAQAIDAPHLANLLAGQLYVNVHSNPDFPNGEIRAQIMPLPLHPEDNVYTCVMSGANEVPPNASVGWGVGTFRLNPTLDSLYYSFMWKLQNTWNASHIHPGLAGQTGSPLHTLLSGGATGAHGVWALSAANVVQLNGDSLYANAHSTGIWTAGEIRDQIHHFVLPPPMPNIQVSLSDVDFPATYVGNSNIVTVQVTNTGTAPLICSELFGRNHVWHASPPSFTLDPAQTMGLDLIFIPSYTHDFKGKFEFVTNDPDSHPTIDLSGTGCTPVQQPPPPILLPSGASDAIYFRLPWDLNSEAVEYAVEYSSDNFATSKYVSATGHGQDLPEWHGLNFWGSESAGAILGLESGTEYAVRSHARDCIDVELVSLSLTSVTPIPIGGLDVSELTIIPLNPTTIRLTWNPEAQNQNHEQLPVTGFEVFRGTTSGSINTLIGADNDNDGIFDVDITGMDMAFFKVVPIIADFGQPHPFIAWPPNGAAVSGLNTIVVNDYLHTNQWGSFDIYIDEEFVGSGIDDPFSEHGNAGMVYDFSQLSDGLHTLSIVVHDDFGNAFPNDDNPADVFDNRTVMPYVGFDATYSPSSGIFACDTVNGENIDGSIVDILWQNTQGQESYGPTFDFKWLGPDSVVLVKPNPISSTKVLTEDSPTDYRYMDEYAALTPTITDFKWDVIEITCCCDDIHLNTAGQSEAKYKGEANKRNLGPVVKCTNGNYVVSYAFEVVVVFKYSIVDEGGMVCEYGQDCKRTETVSTGGCDDNDMFQPLDPPIPDDITHKKHGGTDYPASGSEFGNDEYGSRPGDHGMNTTVPGQISWYDNPWSHGRLPHDDDGNFAIRTVRHATFLAKATPQCEPINIECCIEWDLDWDVTFCEDCAITQTVPPTISNEITPAECPDLAP